MDVGPAELIIILAIVLLLFGSAKLPKLARSLGQAQKEFKQGLAEGQRDDAPPSSAEPPAPAAAGEPVAPVAAADPPRPAAAAAGEPVAPVEEPAAEQPAFRDDPGAGGSFV